MKSSRTKKILSCHQVFSCLRQNIFSSFFLRSLLFFVSTRSSRDRCRFLKWKGSDPVHSVQNVFNFTTIPISHTIYPRSLSLNEKGTENVLAKKWKIFCTFSNSVWPSACFFFFLVWCLDNEAFEVRKLLLHKAYNVAIRQQVLGSLLTIFTKEAKRSTENNVVLLFPCTQTTSKLLLRSLCTTSHIFDFCKRLKTHFQELSHLFDDVKLRNKNAKLFTTVKEKSPLKMTQWMRKNTLYYIHFIIANMKTNFRWL